MVGVAQLVERAVVVRVVVGSIPTVHPNLLLLKHQVIRIAQHQLIRIARGVAQLVELPAFNRKVAGSIPAAPTNYKGLIWIISIFGLSVWPA